MFAASKLIQILLQPSNLLVLLLLAGIASLLIQRSRLGVVLICTSASLLAVAGWSPAGPYALSILENRFPSSALPDAITGIVMLGGAVDTHLTAGRGQVTVNDAAERIFAVAILARRFPDARIVLSGGAADLMKDDSATESSDARRLLVELGIPADRFMMEERSRTTFENARESVVVAAPLAGEIWLLVTSAFNMPRAVASFRAVGFPVVPYPVDFRTRPADRVQPLRSIARGLDFTDAAAHEWLGLIGYWITGRTTELFPESAGF